MKPHDQGGGPEGDLPFCAAEIFAQAAELYAEAEAWELPDMYGVYTIYEQIGQGGAGVVYRARHLELGREVALKVLHHGPFAKEEETLSYRREIEAAARLDHPHVLKVFDVHLADEVLAVSLPLCSRGTLADLLSTDPELTEVIPRVKEVYDALGHAHDRGQLHLDVKAANVLLGDDGSALLADFGVGAAIALGGRIGGTPGWSSPEQVKGRDEVTTLADVYGAGKLLQAVLESATGGRRLEDLKAVAAKACASNPGERYGSVRDLKKELERWECGRPVEARPLSAFGVGWYWTNRNRALAGVLVLLFGALLCGAVLLWQSSQEVREAQRLTDQALQEQMWSRIEGELKNGSSTVAAHLLAQFMVRYPDDPVASLTLGSFFDHRRHFELEEFLRQEEWQERQKWPNWQWLEDERKDRILTCHARSPDGNRVALGDRFGRVTIHEAESGRRATTIFRHGFQVKGLAFSPDTRFLISGAGDHRVRAWSLETGFEVAEPQVFGSGIRGMRIDSPSGSSDYDIWVACYDGVVAKLKLMEPEGVVDLDENQLVVQQTRTASRVKNPPKDRPLPPGFLIAYDSWRGLKVAMGPRQIFAFNDSGKVVWKYRAGARLVQMAIGGSRLWFAQMDGLAISLDEKGRVKEQINTGGALFAALPSPDGTRLLTAGFESELSVWQVEDGRRVAGPLKGLGLLDVVGWTKDGSPAALIKRLGWKRLSERKVDSRDAVRLVEEVTQTSLLDDGLKENRVRMDPRDH